MLRYTKPADSAVAAVGSLFIVAQDLCRTCAVLVLYCRMTLKGASHFQLQYQGGEHKEFTLLLTQIFWGD